MKCSSWAWEISNKFFPKISQFVFFFSVEFVELCHCNWTNVRWNTFISTNWSGIHEIQKFYIFFVSSLVYISLLICCHTPNHSMTYRNPSFRSNNTFQTLFFLSKPKWNVPKMVLFLWFNRQNMQNIIG